jgi:GNAT superfamily N-acetyltransferase
VIRLCGSDDFTAIASIINDAAEAYRGVIPEDCWHEPYMPEAELRDEIGAGVVFWGYQRDADLLGVIGLQDVDDVALIRHAYVRSKAQGSGVGAALLEHLQSVTAKPMLIGTWAAAHWALRFYRRYGFEVTGPEQKDRLLRRYWTVPDRQIETSVVLADARWREREPAR